MIGGSQALNDTGFGSGNMPYVQFKSVSDFIPKPRCSKFVVGLQTRRRNSAPVGRAESDRSSAMG